MTAAAVYEVMAGRVRVDATGLGSGSTALVERSTDGAIWTTVQGATAVPVLAGNLAWPVYDHIFTPGVANTYRVTSAATDVVTAADTFTRTVANGWGTSTSGSVWTSEGGSTADQGVNGAKGWHDAQLAATTKRTLTAGPADGDAYFDVSIPEVSTGEAAQSAFIVREDGTNANFLCFRVVFLTTGYLDSRISIRQASVETTIANGPATKPYTAGVVVHMRCRWQGASLKLRMWTSGAEPSTWDAEVSDSTFLAAGRMGFRSSVGTDWASWAGTVPLRFTYDNLSVAQVVTTVQTAAAITPNLFGAVWLLSATRPFLKLAVDVVYTSPVISQPARAGVFDVMGRTVPVAVTDVRQSKRWTMQVRTTEQDEADMLEAILTSGDVLYVSTLTGSPTPAGYVIAGDATWEAHPLRPLRRLWSVPVVQVATPDPALPAAMATWRSLTSQQGSWAAVVATYADWATVQANLVGDPSEVYAW